LDAALARERVGSGDAACQPIARNRIAHRAKANRMLTRGNALAALAGVPFLRSNRPPPSSATPKHSA